MKAITSALILVSLFTQAQAIKKISTMSNKIIFDVVIDSALNKKPYILIFENGVINNNKSGQKKVEPKSVKGNSYLFELNDQTKPRYFSIILTESNKADLLGLSEYHFEPGDNVRITIKPTKVFVSFKLDFSGRGSAKYRCRNEYLHLKIPDTLKNRNAFSKEGKYNEYNGTLWRLGAAYNLVEKYKPELSGYSYNLLHADILGRFGKLIYFDLDIQLNNLLNKKNTIGFKAMRDDFLGKLKYDLSEDIPDGILLDSKDYADFLLNRIVAENKMEFIVLNHKAIYENIKATKNTALRDKMILIFFATYWQKINNDFEGLLGDALITVKNQECLSILKEYDRHRAGNKAYNFSLTDVNDKKVLLSDFKDKVVFIDFWFTGCTFCKRYYKSVLSKVESLYEKDQGIVFITVSLDKDKETWIKSLNEGEYTSAKAVNLYTNGEGVYNDVIRYYNIASYPRPMLIGRRGEIILSNGNELRNIDRLISEIDKALKKVK